MGLVGVHCGEYFLSRSGRANRSRISSLFRSMSSGSRTCPMRGNGTLSITKYVYSFVLPC